MCAADSLSAGSTHPFVNGKGRRRPMPAEEKPGQNSASLRAQSIMRAEPGLPGIRSLFCRIPEKKPYLDGWCSCVFWTLYVTLDVERERRPSFFFLCARVCNAGGGGGKGLAGPLLLLLSPYPPLQTCRVCVCMVVEKSLQVDHCSRGRQWSASSRPRRTLLLRRPTVGALSLHFLFFSLYHLTHTPRLLLLLFSLTYVYRT